MMFVHSSPIIYSSIELHCTEMVFLKRDSKWCFLAGVIYFFCNMWGSFYVLGGKPIYPIPGFTWDPEFSCTFCKHLCSMVSIIALRTKYSQIEAGSTMVSMTSITLIKSKTMMLSFRIREIQFNEINKKTKF